MTSSGLVISHETTTQLDSESTRSMATESYRGDQMFTAGDLLPTDTDKTNLLRGSCNDDPFESSDYGTMSYRNISTNSS